jgi:hypothetical protein
VPGSKPVMHSLLAHAPRVRIFTLAADARRAQ